MYIAYTNACDARLLQAMSDASIQLGYNDVMHGKKDQMEPAAVAISNPRADNVGQSSSWKEAMNATQISRKTEKMAAERSFR